MGRGGRERAAAAQLGSSRHSITAVDLPLPLEEPASWQSIIS
jgi:hypothetical protein